MAGDYNLYAKGILNQFSTYSVAHVTTGAVTIATATITIGGAFVAQSSDSGSVYAAYRDLWERLNDGQVGLLPPLTTTEKDALTGVSDGVGLVDITRGRIEVRVGGVFQDTTKKFTVSGITASTTQSQGNGLLTGDVNVISTVGNVNDVVTLPTAKTGITVIVVNNGSKKIKIFPNTSDDLGAGVDSSISLAAGSSIIFHCFDTINWVST